MKTVRYQQFVVGIRLVERCIMSLKSVYMLVTCRIPSKNKTNRYHILQVNSLDSGEYCTGKTASLVRS